MSGGAQSEPVEEQEVLVLPQQTGAGNRASEHAPPPGRSRMLKAAVIGSTIAILGTAAALVHKASMGTGIAEPAASAVTLNDNWNNNNNNWNGGSDTNWNNNNNNNNWNNDGNKVRCGQDASCTCEWANEGQCGRIDNPGSACWKCCCRQLYPQQYQWAIGRGDGSDFGQDHWRQDNFDEDFGQEPEHGHGDGKYHRGEEVNVQSHRGTWHPATVLQRINPGTYQVQYDISRRVEVVHKDRMTPGIWTPWWVWVFWLCLLSCCLVAVVGFVGWFTGKGKKGDRGEGAIEERPLFDTKDDNDRSCTRVCS